MDHYKKIEPQFLDKVKKCGIESVQAFPVFVTLTDIRKYPRNFKKVKFYSNLNMIYGEIQVGQLKEFCIDRNINYIWDAAAEIQLTPFLPNAELQNRTDIRAIIINPKNKKLPIDASLLTGEKTKIAIIDTSADIHHSDITSAIKKVADCTDDRDFNKGDKTHATHVGGIALQIAPKSNLLFYKVFSVDNIATRKYIVDAILEAVNDAVDVINGSWGETLCQGGCPIDQAVTYAVKQGIMFCGSAGNKGDRSGHCTLTCPAGNINMITVGACTCDSHMADFSSRGPSYVDGSTKPDVSAPGVDIASCRPGGGYHALSGTSMAAPVLSGTYVVIKSTLNYLYQQSYGESHLTSKDIKTALVKSAKNLGYDPNHQGAGLVNLIGALNYLIDEYGLKISPIQIVKKVLQYAVISLVIVFAGVFSFNLKQKASGDEEQIKRILPTNSHKIKDVERISGNNKILQNNKLTSQSMPHDSSPENINDVENIFKILELVKKLLLEEQDSEKAN